MSPAQFQQAILAWYDLHGRKDLPWQQNITPYRVWVSEIMLQQTQVASVIDYFNRFLARFPDIFALANAELDHVLQHWSGLGYYARARNLHRTAKLIAEQGGNFPQSLIELSDLPGIGRSTAGAILAIAFGQCQPILDGNVKRVLTRFHALHGWPGDRQVATRLWQFSETYTPAERTANYTQAMMDLGATLCTRSKPRCHACPLAPGCQALAQNLVNQLPQTKPRKNLPVKHCQMLILRDQHGRILLEKRPPSGIWGGLYSLPEFDDSSAIQQWTRHHQLAIDQPVALPNRLHTFSHFQLDFTPQLAQCKNPGNFVMEAERLVWYKAADLQQLGLPTPIRRLLLFLDSETSK